MISTINAIYKSDIPVVFLNEEPGSPERFRDEVSYRKELLSPDSLSIRFNMGKVLMYRGKKKGCFMNVLPKILFLTMAFTLILSRVQTGTCHAQLFTKPLKTEYATPAELTGTFTAILFGGAHHDDLETVAFLDIEGDQYTIEPFAPDFDYVMKENLPAQEALRVTEKFVSFHPSFWKTQLAKILSAGGSIVGFEIRPLYIPFVYGTSDVLDIHYWPKKQGKVRVTVTLIPSLRSIKFHPGGDGGFGGSH